MMRRTATLPLTALLIFGCAGQKATPDATATTATVGAAAKSLTAQERESAQKELEETRQAFLNAIKGLSEAQFRFKPAPDRWSIAEVAEHITVTEERIMGMITTKVMTTPATPEMLAKVQHDDSRIRQLVTNRSQKVQAPEMLRPTGRFPTLESVTTAFNQDRDKTENYVQSTQDDLRGHAMPHPILKALDGYQWLLLVSAHCARHTAQIDEVKADPHFPRS